MSGFRPILDLPYGAEADDPKQRLDLYLPGHGATPPGGESGTYPVVVFLHGGVWAMGDRREIGNVGAALAARGIIAALPSYRLAPAHPHPAQIEDAARAVAWVAARAPAHGGDPRQLVLAGHSAGAHLATLLVFDRRWLGARGLGADQVGGVAGLAGVYDLESPFGERGQDTAESYVERVFGPPGPVWQESSPLALVTQARLQAPPAVEDRIPILLVTAEHDYAGIQVQTAEMAAALRAAGFPTRTFEAPGRDHDTLIDRIGTAQDQVAGVLVRFVHETAAARRAKR